MAITLEQAVTGIKSPVTTPRGLAARLRYLTQSDGGREAMARAGITVKPETVDNWIEKKTVPKRGNLEKIDAAYWDYRRRNLAKEFKTRLNDNGRGTEIEIYPVDQSQVEQKYKRDIQIRRKNIRGTLWNAVVDAWVEGDEDALDVCWDEVLNELDSDYDSYTYVTAVGFGV
ncbi:transcriptional regulator [Kitasatospora sp. NPDC002227]|uniref:transcriptional regulator n=1 Tax=Kitasatospora sp. NPDC002227 TaxID=3154773 RepID=UPI0033344137